MHLLLGRVSFDTCSFCYMAGIHWDDNMSSVAFVTALLTLAFTFYIPNYSPFHTNFLSCDIFACNDDLSPFVFHLIVECERERGATNGSRNKLIIPISTGTGGTISGVGRFLKSVKRGIKVVLADPEGSGLYNKVSSGACTDLCSCRRRDPPLLVLCCSGPFL